MTVRSRFAPFATPAFGVAVLGGVSLVSLAAHAQDAALGNIAGIVRDNSGAVVPGITVTVTNTGTGASRKLTTDA